MEALSIDEKASRKKARELLGMYRSKYRLLGHNFDHYITLRKQNLSSMPNSGFNRNINEDRMIKELAKEERRKLAYEFLIEINETLLLLPKVSADLLRLAYCEKDKYTTYEISAKLISERTDCFGQVTEIQYSYRNIERLKSIALIEFAEAYKGGELIVIKQEG